MNFLNNSRILIIFLFKSLDELWDYYNAIFYLLNNLVDSIVSVFLIGFNLVFFHSLVYSFIILLFIIWRAASLLAPAISC